MVAGIDVLLFKPDAELKRLARLALDTGVDSAFVQDRSPQEIDDELAGSEASRAWLAGAREGQGPVVQHGHGRRALPLLPKLASTTRASRTPRSSATWAPSARARRSNAPPKSSSRERDRLASEYGALLDEETRKGFDELLGLCKLVFPYVEEHKFLCDYWFLTTWWNKVRSSAPSSRSTGYLQDGEDVFQLSRTELQTALDELVLVWATGGEPLGPKHWPPIVARRKAILDRLAEWTPPPAIGAMPEEVTDPVLNMLWGSPRNASMRGHGARTGIGAERGAGIARRGRGCRSGRQDGSRARGRDATARSSCAASPLPPGLRSSRR